MEIKCLNCGGNKYKEIKPGTFKCVYCGTIFSIKDDKEKQGFREDLDKKDEEKKFLSESGNDIKRPIVMDTKNINDIVRNNAHNPPTSETRLVLFILFGLIALSIFLILL